MTGASRFLIDLLRVPVGVIRGSGQTPSPFRSGSAVREIAEAIGRAFDLPVTSIAPDHVQDHFGWIGTFFAMDLSATSTVTRELLGWTSIGPTLIEDLDAGAYSAR